MCNEAVFNFEEGLITARVKLAVDRASTKAEMLVYEVFGFNHAMKFKFHGVSLITQSWCMLYQIDDGYFAFSF